MKSFWQHLTRPFTVLAPMEDVTDTVFRQIVASIARPDVFFTEFTSVEGLFSDGRKNVIHRLTFTKSEKPLIAQIWGRTPSLFYQAAQLIESMGFDGIDINFGCPEKSIMQHGGGAACIDEPDLAKEIIIATKAGTKNLPVSVKTRLGNMRINSEWIPFLLSLDIDALTIHGRTAREQSLVPARWDHIGKAVTIRNSLRKETIIIGNGDVVDYCDAVKKSNTFGIDGIMIGRGIFKNLWAFNKSGENHMNDHEKLRKIMLEHVRLFNKTWGSTKNFAILKKFFKMYVQGFPNATDVRERLMSLSNANEIASFEFPKIPIMH